MTIMPKLRHATSLAASLLLIVSLAGCGFTPLYGDNSLTQSLAGVQVEVPSHSRAGYLVRQALDDELGRARGDAPRYVVALNLYEGKAPRGVRVNNVASRYEIGLFATYSLKDAQTGAFLTSGSFTTQTTYDSVDAPYAGLAAFEEGEERAAGQAAVRLRLELARYINGHPYHEAATAAGRVDRYRPKAGAPTLSTNAEDEDAPRNSRGRDPSDAVPPAGDPPPPAPQRPSDPLPQ